MKKIRADKDEYKEAIYGLLGYDDAETHGTLVDRIFDIIERMCK